MKPKFLPLRSRIFNRLLIGLVLIAVLLSLCYIIYQFLEKTKYIYLPIPSPSSDLPRGDWVYVEYATRIWNDSGEKYFILRREVNLLSTDYHSQEYKTWQDVFAYFDNWLIEHNWKLYQEPLYDPCRNFLPESEFLPRGEGGYVIYRHIDSTPFAAEPTVCLAIWEFPTSLGSINDKWFNIVFITVNPSKLTEFNSEWSLMR